MGVDWFDKVLTCALAWLLLMAVILSTSLVLFIGYALCRAMFG